MAKTAVDYIKTHKSIMIIILVTLILIGLIQALFLMRQQAYDKAFPKVDVGYGIYRGYYNESLNLNYFNGIRYAAPPTGVLRWQKPQEPPKDRESVISATDYSPRCPQSNHGPKPENWFYEIDQVSEDCLFLNIITPTNASNLPVLVWMHGGGYGLGDGRYDFTELLVKNSRSFVVVSIQYRLGAFGFMSSSELTGFGVPNAGLYDQHFALQWIQKHIAQFGGDPKYVTIAGQSAGGGGVLQQALAYGGTQGTKFFTNMIVASPYLPPQYYFNDTQPTNAYNSFKRQVGCSDELENSTIFKCLSTKDTYALQNASAYVSVNADYGQWAFLPVIDEIFIQKNPVEQLLAGSVNGLRMLSGHNSDEAPAFVPQSINTTSDFERYALSLHPYIDNQTITEILQTYIIPETKPGPLFSTLGSSGPTALNQSLLAIGQQQRANNLYAELTFVCPSYWIAHAFTSDDKKAWKYQFSVPPAAHGSDFNAYYKPSHSILSEGTLSSGFRSGMQLSWGRFISYGDPTLPTSVINSIISNNSYSDKDELYAAQKSSWIPWNMDTMTMLNMNMTGGVERSIQFFIASGKSINITIHKDPGLKAFWDISHARTWEGGRGNRCDLWAKLINKHKI